MRTKWHIFILLVMLTSCKDHGLQPLSTDPYLRWRSYDLHNYTVDQIRMCFCPDGGEAMRISVQSDTIASVTRLSNGLSVPGPELRLYLTVESLFTVIHGSTTDSLVIRYNEVYGYPEMLDINPQLHPVDGGVLYTTSNLRIQ